GGVDLSALDAVLPTVSRYVPCLAVGVVLGPIATALYMLAARLAEAVCDIALARPASLPRDEATIGEHAGAALLPAGFAAALLAVAAPALLDIRWWGAILPAQILLLGAVPAALAQVRACVADATSWRGLEVVASVAAVAFAAPFGLVAIATAVVAQAIALTV